MAEAGGLENLKKVNSQDSTKVPRLSLGQAIWWRPAITMFLKLSVWIAGPVIIALYLGKWLDDKYQSQPWLFLICIGLAFIISIFGLVRNTARELKKLEKSGSQAGVADKNK